LSVIQLSPSQWFPDGDDSPRRECRQIRCLSVIRLPSATDPDVSVIVVLDGAVEMAETCLRALAAADDPVPCETMIVLNDPDAALEDLVRKGTTGAETVVIRANAGPVVGWNLGASIARAPRLATLHEDSEPDAGWLAPLCEAMSESGAGAVGSRLYNRDGSVQNCGWVLFSDASAQPINGLSAPEVVAASDPTPADLVSGAAMLLDRDALRAAGGWDERFQPTVFGDIDISTAIWSQGRPVLSVPASGVRHESGALLRREGSALTGPLLGRFLFERHRDRFVSKWGRVVRGLAPPPPDGKPESIRGAVQAALPRTRERAELIRSGGRRQSGPDRQAERPFSGNADDMLDRGEGTHAVAAEVEEALNAAEMQLVGEYCRWLTRVEKSRSAELHQARALLEHRDRELGEVRAHAEGLQRDREELATTLDRMLHSFTWRLRAMARRVIEAPLALFRRARRGRASRA
jgi:GT2 family glycosyltransferase